MSASPSKASGIMTGNGRSALEKKDNKGDSPLHIAARKGNAEVVKMLLSLGISIDEENDCGERPLYLAVTSGQEEAVRCLLNAGADIHSTTAEGCSVWHAAASAGNADILKLLHDRSNGARSGQSDKSPEDSVVSTDKGSTKAKSIITGSVDSTKGRVVTINKQDVTSPLGGSEKLEGKSEITRISQESTEKKSVADERDKSWQHFQRKDSNLNFSSDSEDEQCSKINAGMLTKIVEYMSITDRDSDNAKSRNDLKTFLSTKLGKEMLLNSTCENGLTPLHVAAESGSDEALKWFLNKRPHEVNAPGKLGETPLHVAAARGTARMIELLIKAGAKYDTVDNLGNTVLHRAAIGQNLQTLKKLLSLGLDPKAKNVLGMTPLHLACAYPNNNEIIKELLQHGASLSQPDYNEITPRMLLQANGSKID